MAAADTWTTIRTFRGDDARRQADFARRILDDVAIEAQVLDPGADAADSTPDASDQAELSVKTRQVTEACRVVDLLGMGDQTVLAVDATAGQFPFGLASLAVAGAAVYGLGDALSDQVGYAIMAGAYIAGRVFRVLRAPEACSACGARAKRKVTACSACGKQFVNRV